MVDGDLHPAAETPECGDRAVQVHARTWGDLYRRLGAVAFEQVEGAAAVALEKLATVEPVVVERASLDDDLCADQLRSEQVRAHRRRQRTRGERGSGQCRRACKHDK